MMCWKCGSSKVMYVGDMVNCQTCGAEGYPADFDGGNINKEIVLTAARCPECRHLNLLTDQWYHLFESDCSCQCNMVLKDDRKGPLPRIEPKGTIR